MEARLSRIQRLFVALPAPPLHGLLAPLDALRARLLRVLGRPLRPLVVSRDKRVALGAALLLGLAYLLATTVPLWVVALGPIVWGIPHLISDVRYLLVRPGLHRRPLLVVISLAGLAAAALGTGVRGALIAALVALLVSRGSMARRALGAGVLAGLLGAAIWAGWLADLVFVHLHNVVAFGLWWAFRKREGKVHVVPLALFALGAALLLAGAAEPILARTGGLAAGWTGLSVRTLGVDLNPMREAAWSARFVTLYAFAQSAHYIVWLRLIPEDDRRSPTPRSYAQSFRALIADVGTLVLWGALLGAIALAVWACFTVSAARDGYLRLAFFHGYFELIAAAVLFAEGLPARSPSCPQAQGR